MNWDPLNLGAVLVAIIAALGAWASQRAAARASKYNADANTMSAKAAAELEAYNRARAMDTETITRQDRRIDELEEENERITNKFKALQNDYEGLLQTCRGHREELDQLRALVERLQGEKKE